MTTKFGIMKLETSLYRMVRNMFRYLESFKRGSPVCLTDRRTDRLTKWLLTVACMAWSEMDAP